MKIKQPRLLTFVTLILVLGLTVASYYGAFVPGTYAKDAVSIAAQGMGQDIFDLFVVGPLLLLSLIGAFKKNKIAFYIYSGTVFYVLYSFFIYAFGVHFNFVFLWYCLTLGSAFYTFVLILNEVSGVNLKSWFHSKISVRPIGIYLIFIAVLFYLLWLKDVVPAVLGHTLPRDVSQYGLLVNPVHVMDIALALPGLIFSSVLLIKKKSLGFFFAPVYLVFITLLTLALVAMAVMVKIKGISDDIALVYIFSVLALINILFLGLFFRNVKFSK
jgi:hypothetical protein